MKTAELTGALLDYWVARAMDYFDGVWINQEGVCVFCIEPDTKGPFKPSTDWADGGPIIEREKISLELEGDLAPGGEQAPYAYVPGAALAGCFGPTPLIAAMRSYVASKFGDEVPATSTDGAAP